MNRADQAPEPSIEELLASIRLIISDADKQAPFQKEPRAPGMPAGAGQAAGAPNEVDAGEVFDLTDELVFPEETGRPQPAPPRAGMRGQSGFDGYSGLQAHLGVRRAPALPAPDGASAMLRARAGQERLDPTAALRPEARKPAQAPVSAPVWSRPELPAGAAQPPIAPERPRQEQLSGRPLARNWAGDVQMPVPDQGPVSLFPSTPGQGQPETPGAGGTGLAKQQAGAQAEPPAAPADAEGPAAVAALAQRLARSAIGVLEASELENAKQVDFEHLDAMSRAEVTERFADAIESVAQAVQEEPDLPEMADGQIPQSAPQEQPVRQEQPAAKMVAEAAPAPVAEAPWDIEAEAVAMAEVPVQAEVKAESRAEPEPEEAAAEPVPAPSPVSAEPVRPASPVQMALATQPLAPAPRAAQQPLAQVQFMGAAQPPVSATGGGPLETAVREMLRPLLVQWLNENMPRILESAIREEISVRGLLPKSDS